MAGLRHLSLRKAVVAAARRLGPLGINQGTSGNVSVRAGDGLLVTPSGIPYDELTPGQIVWMDPEGRFEGDWLPSSEWQFHCDILRARPDLNAVVHTHAVHATALACHGKGIPAFHYMVAAAGGGTSGARPTRPSAPRNCRQTPFGRSTAGGPCLLANHGIIACGCTLDDAVALAAEVETLASMYLKALEIGPPDELDDAEMSRVLRKFATYGQNPGARS